MLEIGRKREQWKEKPEDRNVENREVDEEIRRQREAWVEREGKRWQRETWEKIKEIKMGREKHKKREVTEKENM